MEKNVETGNGNKPMTDKQRNFIESLVIDRNVDESYKNCVRKALDNGLNRLQASKIIDFLMSFIDFKKCFIVGNNGDNGGMYGSHELHGMSEGISSKKDSRPLDA